MTMIAFKIEKQEDTACVSLSFAFSRRRKENLRFLGEPACRYEFRTLVYSFHVPIKYPRNHNFLQYQVWE